MSGNEASKEDLEISSPTQENEVFCLFKDTVDSFLFYELCGSISGTSKTGYAAELMLRCELEAQDLIELLPRCRHG